jgi:hypothetical protein
MSKMLQDLKKKKRFTEEGTGSGKDVLPGDESQSHIDPVYKSAKMSVLSDIANRAGKSMGHDLQAHNKAKIKGLPGMADSEEAKKMLLKHADPEGHNADSMDMLDNDEEENSTHGMPDARGEQEHQRYAKGGRVGSLGPQESKGITKYQDSEEDSENKANSGDKFDFGKNSRGKKEDALREESGYENDEVHHPEEESPYQLGEKNEKKYGRWQDAKHEYEPGHTEPDDDLVGMSEEDVKAMMDHLDKHLKSKWQQNKN